MSHNTPEHARRTLISLLFLLAILLPTVLAGRYGVSGPRALASIAPAAGPDVCLLPYDPRPPVPWHAPGVGVHPRLRAYPATWPIPIGPRGIRVALRYLPLLPLATKLVEPVDLLREPSCPQVEPDQVA